MRANFELQRDTPVEQKQSTPASGDTIALSILLQWRDLIDAIGRIGIENDAQTGTVDFFSGRQDDVGHALGAQDLEGCFLVAPLYRRWFRWK